MASVKDYCESYSFEREELTLDDRYNEYIMTSLRTMWGVDVDYIQKSFGKDCFERFKKEIKRYIVGEKVYQKGQKYILNDGGMLFADGIAAELFIPNVNKI